LCSEFSFSHGICRCVVRVHSRLVHVRPGCYVMCDVHSGVFLSFPTYSSMVVG
jgi:hypothetical protein